MLSLTAPSKEEIMGARSGMAATYKSGEEVSTERNHAGILIRLPAFRTVRK